MGLKVWLPLNGTLENKGVLPLTSPNNVGSVINSNGKIGSCYSFNGSNQRIEFTHDKTAWNNKEISICMWYKYIEGNTTNAMVDIAADLCLSYTYSSSQVRFNYWRAYSNNGTRTGDSGSGNYYDASKWHHVVLTCDHNINKIYVDGILDVTFDRSSKYTTNWTPLLGTSYNKITLAKSAGSSPYGSGYLNDVRIYDHCLSAAEVREISQGLVLHYQLNAHNLINKSTLTSNNYINASGGLTSTSGWYASDYISIIPGHTYQTFDLSHGGSNTRIAFYDINKTYKRNVTIVANENLTLTAAEEETYMRVSIRNLANELQIASVVEVPNIIEDSSGYNHNGTIIKSPIITTDSPRYSSCLHISATNQHIQCGTITTAGFSNSYSFSWWGKASTFSGTMQWGFADGVRLNGIYNGTLWNTGDSSNNPLYNPGTTTQVTAPTTGVWHHFVMVGDGTSCKVYKDGIHWGTAKTYKTISGTQIYINGWANSTAYSHSDLSISDFRIYCTALNADAVRQLYEVGAKVDNKGNLHTFELSESNNGRELLAVPLTTSYGNHTNIYTNYDINGEITLTGGNSIGSYYIPINPSGKTYYYDIEISTDSGNVFYIGFQRYDANKTARSNDATVYLSGLSGSSEARTHKHYHGTVDLSTDGVNPCAFTSLRILNDWSGANNRHATIHKISLREVSTLQNTKINKYGQAITTELIEMNDKFRVHKNGIIETNEIIEL